MANGNPKATYGYVLQTISKIEKQMQGSMAWMLLFHVLAANLSDQTKVIKFTPSLIEFDHAVSPMMALMFLA